jgi:hypothetical protein
MQVGGNIGSDFNASIGSASFDATYQDYDGGSSIRILNPCTSGSDFTSAQCAWFDNVNVLRMQKRRWYSAAEALADGSIAIIGGFVNGGYVNRNFPNTDPTLEGGAAEPTYEFYPSKGAPQEMTFMTTTSGLNAYAHTYLMPSGNMFLQANLSTIMWNWTTNVETPLPNMPNGVARVYPASGATAMMPLTPANNWTPTILFCGGSDMPSDDYGNYSFPAINTWNYPASTDCQNITPEPQDGSSPTYTQDDSMPVGRTMGQFILLPDATMLVLNGGQNGTAGYATATGQTPNVAQMPFGESLASGPVGQPALYTPGAPSGSRWSQAGFATSNIPRLYHSSAMLLPDGSVMVAGSNPNLDVNTSTIYPTTYAAEIFYPAYFSASVRPSASGIPTTLSYGGPSFDLLVPATAYSGSGNSAAANATVAITRGGFTTHAMNMGQRYMQLNNTYTVNSNGSITLHVAQPPPNPNLFQPGPAMLWVVIDGIPSNGTFLIVGTGDFGTQPTQAASTLPNSVQLNSASGSAKGGNTSSTTSHTAELIGIIVGGIAVIGIVGAFIGIFLAKRRRARAAASMSSYAMSPPVKGGKGGMQGYNNKTAMASTDTGAFLAQNVGYNDNAWASSASLHSPYRDEMHEQPGGYYGQDATPRQSMQQNQGMGGYQQHQSPQQGYQQPQQQGGYQLRDGAYTSPTQQRSYTPQGYPQGAQGLHSQHSSHSSGYTAGRQSQASYNPLMGGQQGQQGMQPNRAGYEQEFDPYISPTSPQNGMQRPGSAQQRGYGSPGGYNQPRY